MKNLFRKIKMPLIYIGIILYFMLVYIFLYGISLSKIKFLSVISIFSVLFISLILIIDKYKSNKSINLKIIITAIILIGIILRTAYILYTPINIRQHDVTGEHGHLKYIEILYSTNKLPATNKWQFYQQPLHHILSSLWLKCNTFLNIELSKSVEGIQILTAIYSSFILLIIYSILKSIKIKDTYKILILLLLSIHPTMIILSGSINNDILMLMFTFCVILYLIKWYKNPCMKNTIILALFTALVALSKISGTIIAIPIMYVFLLKFFKKYLYNSYNKKKIIKEYFLKFTIFGIISLGIGLSFSIRNMALFNQSIFAVPAPSNNIYCGDRSLIDRLNPFSTELLNDTYCHPYEDCNVFAYIIKCSLFGEFNIDNLPTLVLPKLLIILNIIIIILSLFCLIHILYSYKKIPIRTKFRLNIFIIIYLSQIFLYIYSNYHMPYGCTMDFRYIVPTIFTGIFFISQYLINCRKHKWYLHKIIAIYTLIFIFSIACIVFELTYMPLLKL